MTSKENSYVYRVRYILRLMTVVMLTAVFICIAACFFAPNKEYRIFCMILAALLFAVCVIGGLLQYFRLYTFYKELTSYEENSVKESRGKPQTGALK